MLWVCVWDGWRWTRRERFVEGTNHIFHRRPLRNIQMAHENLLCACVARAYVCVCIDVRCQASKSFNIFSIMTKSTITPNGWIRHIPSNIERWQKTNSIFDDDGGSGGENDVRTKRTMAHYNAKAIHHRCSVCVRLYLPLLLLRPTWLGIHFMYRNK